MKIINFNFKLLEYLYLHIHIDIILFINEIKKDSELMKKKRTDC